MLGIHTALNIVTKGYKQQITALQQTKTETSFLQTGIGVYMYVILQQTKTETSFCRQV